MNSIVFIIMTRRVVPILWLLILVVPSINAQETSKNAKLLIGTWELDYNQSIAKASGPGKTHYDTISYERKSRIVDSFSQRKMIFQPDGTYVLVVRSGKEVNGTWELQRDDESLNIVLDGKLIEQRIEQISASFMIINLGGDQTANRLFKRWYLNKVGS